MTSIDSVNEVVLYLLRNLHLRSFYVLSKEFYLLYILDALELVLQFILPVGNHVVQSLYVLLRQGKHHLSLEWDGVAHVAALP